MTKIPFDIKFRPQIESGEYKVETRDGLPVRVVCYDAEGRFPVVAIVNGFPASMYTECGCVMNNEGHGKYDLFIITPEPELSAFEVKLWEIMKAEGSSVGPREKFTNDDKRAFHEYSAQLLAIASKELQPEKDLPRWKKCEDGNTDRLELEALGREAGSPFEIAFRANGYRIFLSDLQKLPKEDEK